MTLADDIQTLQDRTLAALNAAHDYFVDTKSAWDIVLELVQGGHEFTIRNQLTGTVTSQAELAGKARGYVAEQLAQATFQQFISIFEAYFFDLLRLWLLTYPGSLKAKQIDFKMVLDAPDKDAITQYVVNKELNELLYERPSGWFAYLEGKARLNCPTPDEIEQIAEAKAARDVLIHNQGVAGKQYETKAGNFARYTDGQRIEIPQEYHQQTWELIRKVVTDLSMAAMDKVR